MLKTCSQVSSTLPSIKRKNVQYPRNLITFTETRASCLVTIPTTVTKHQLLMRFVTDIPSI